MTEHFVGIDVSKATLDVAVLPGDTGWQVERTESGIRSLIDALKPLMPRPIVLEATGGLETPLTAALAVAGFALAVVNPRQARDFAKATGQLAKTDAIDARWLARLGEAVKPDARPLKDEQTQELDALLARRRQIVDMPTMEKNRLHAARKRVHRDIAAHIAWLEKRLKDVDGDLKAAIAASDTFRLKDELIRSVPGAGRVLSITLLAGLPELGALTRAKSPPWLGWHR